MFSFLGVFQGQRFSSFFLQGTPWGSPELVLYPLTDICHFISLYSFTWYVSLYLSLVNVQLDLFCGWMWIPNLIMEKKSISNALLKKALNYHLENKKFEIRRLPQWYPSLRTAALGIAFCWPFSFSFSESRSSSWSTTAISAKSF